MKFRKRLEYIGDTSPLFGTLVSFLLLQGVLALVLFFKAGENRLFLLAGFCIATILFFAVQVVRERFRRKRRTVFLSRGKDQFLALISLTVELFRSLEVLQESWFSLASAGQAAGNSDRERFLPGALEGLADGFSEVRDRLEAALPGLNGETSGIFESLERIFPSAREVLTGLTGKGDEARLRVEELLGENRALRQTAAEMLYEIRHSLPAVERLADSSGQYEKKTISSILTQFEQVWDYSKELVEDSGETIARFSREGAKDDRSLSYIGEKNVEITARVESFISLVGKLEKAANQFLESAVGGLESIRSTAGIIEDMAERIKVISINVRIEAARIAGQHSGFHILGQEITAFADQTAQFAQTTHQQIEQTFQQIQPLRDELLEDLSRVRMDMDGIGSAMAPYKEIIDETFINLDKVIHNLNELSLNITTKMKKTIGQLQFHDIINQENEHVIGFLKNLENSCLDRGTAGFSEQFLDDAVKRAIRKAIIDDISALMTTGNERLVVEALRKEMGLEESAEPELDLSESQILDDNTILF